ncbi:MAG: hypothetical protein ACKOHG_13560, partial [Planctomycetia bacterium]
MRHHAERAELVAPRLRPHEGLKRRGPHVRGPEQARSPETILAETRKLVAEGCREITLIGQTVNSYRW